VNQKLGTSTSQSLLGNSKKKKHEPKLGTGMNQTLGTQELSNGTNMNQAVEQARARPKLKDKRFLHK
jgi:hypothetical protein